MRISVRQFRNVIWEEVDKATVKAAEKVVRKMPVGKEDTETVKYVSGDHELNPDKLGEAQAKLGKVTKHLTKGKGSKGPVKKGKPTMKDQTKQEPIKENAEADKAAYDKIMAMITSTLKDPMATKKIGGELADAMGVPSQFTMKSVARKGPPTQQPGQTLSMKSIAREGQEEMDESDAGYSGWLPEALTPKDQLVPSGYGPGHELKTAAKMLEDAVGWLQSAHMQVEVTDPSAAAPLEELYTEVHELASRVDQMVTQYGKHPAADQGARMKGAK